MEASAIAEIKEAIGRFTVAEAEEAVRVATQFDTAEGVEASLAEVFAPRLADLLEADLE